MPELSEEMKVAINICTCEIVDVVDRDNLTWERLEKALTDLVKRILLEALLPVPVNPSLPITPINLQDRCPTCAFDLSVETVGYVCPRVNCPVGLNGITCGTSK